MTDKPKTPFTISFNEEEARTIWNQIQQGTWFYSVNVQELQDFSDKLKLYLGIDD